MLIVMQENATENTIENVVKFIKQHGFDAHISKAPISNVSGVIASVKTSDGSEKLALSLSEKKKYSQLITNEFYKGVAESSINTK